MTTNLIPIGNTELPSADLVLTLADIPVNIHGKGTGLWTAQIQIKNSDDTYSVLGGITEDTKSLAIYAPGTYRVSRPATGVDITCMVDRD